MQHSVLHSCAPRNDGKGTHSVALLCTQVDNSQHTPHKRLVHLQATHNLVHTTPIDTLTPPTHPAYIICNLPFLLDQTLFVCACLVLRGATVSEVEVHMTLQPYLLLWQVHLPPNIVQVCVLSAPQCSEVSSFLLGLLVRCCARHVCNVNSICYFWKLKDVGSC